MEGKKQISIDISTHKKLTFLKYEKEISTQTEVIDFLLKEYENKKDKKKKARN